MLSTAVPGDRRHSSGHIAAVLTCQAVSKDLLKEVQAWKQMRFSEWSTATMDRLQDIKMDQSGKLMDMDSHDGRIKLHYNEELVVLLREVIHIHKCLHMSRFPDVCSISMILGISLGVCQPGFNNGPSQHLTVY